MTYIAYTQHNVSFKHVPFFLFVMVVNSVINLVVNLVINLIVNLVINVNFESVFLLFDF